MEHVEGILGSDQKSGLVSGQKAEEQLFSPFLGDMSMLAEGFLGTGSSPDLPQQLCCCSQGRSLHCGKTHCVHTQDMGPEGSMVLPRPSQLCFQERIGLHGGAMRAGWDSDGN